MNTERESAAEIAAVYMAEGMLVVDFTKSSKITGHHNVVVNFDEMGRIHVTGRMYDYRFNLGGEVAIDEVHPDHIHEKETKTLFGKIKTTRQIDLGLIRLKSYQDMSYLSNNYTVIR